MRGVIYSLIRPRAFPVELVARQYSKVCSEGWRGQTAARSSPLMA